MDQQKNDLTKIEQNVETKPEVKFSWKRILKVCAGVLLVAAVLYGIYFLVTMPKVKSFFADLFLHKKEHYLDCYQQSFYVEAAKAYNQHGEDVNKLKSMGAKDVQLVENKCKGWEQGLTFIKGDILISVDNNNDRKQIEKYLGDRFYGIPYRDQVVK